MVLLLRVVDILMVVIIMNYNIDQSWGWIVHHYSSPNLVAPNELQVPVTTSIASTTTPPTTNSLQQGISSWLSSSSPSSSSSILSFDSNNHQTAITYPPTLSSSTLLSATTNQPSKQDITLLRNAFAEFYGIEPNYEKSYNLLSETITIWETQQLPPDELSALYRVRGDCSMALGHANTAASDYDRAIEYLEKQQPSEDDYEAYDNYKNELVIALLGRARATKSLAKSASTTTGSDSNDASVSTGSKIKYAQQSANDYDRALQLSSREEWDTADERIIDGAVRNPYAAWEWGTVLRVAGQYEAAANAHLIASQSFTEIGDKARAVISLTDAGIDYAAAASSVTSKNNNIKNNNNAKEFDQQAERTLQQAVEQTRGILGSSRDIDLLRRVIAKESEGRIVLAALLWSNNQQQQAETYYGESCIRLDQLQNQIDVAAEKLQKSQSQKQSQAPPPPGVVVPPVNTNRVLFSIDDEIIVPRGLSCTTFKKSSYVSDILQWPESLQAKVIKLETLQL